MNDVSLQELKASLCRTEHVFINTEFGFLDLKLYFSNSARWVSSQTEALKTPEVLLDGRNAHSKQREETHYERSHFSDITWHSGFFTLGEIKGYADT